MKSHEELEEELRRLDERVLEQEHRPLAAIKNFITLRPTLPKDDPRRRAILFSVVWSLFFSPGGVAAMGSVVAVASLALLGWQNYLMRDSNQLLLTQIQSEERVALQSQRLTAIRDLYGNESPSLRSEALLTLTTITKRLYELAPDHTHLIRRDLREANLENCNLDYKEIDAFDFSGARFQGARVNAGALSSCLFYGTHFSGAELGSAFIGGIFSDLKLDNTVKADGAVFSEVTFTKVDFTTFNPTGAEFKDCKFQHCTMPPNSRFFMEAKISGRTEVRDTSLLTRAEKEAFSKRTGALFLEGESWD